MPKYTDAEDGDTFVLSGSEDLVALFRRNQNGDVVFNEATGQPEIQDDRDGDYRVRRYRPRIEGAFTRIERWTRISDPSDIHWRSITRDNILTLYGADQGSRIQEPAAAGAPGRIYSWLISETRDDRGNAILYRYKSEDGAGIDLSDACERNRGGRDDARRATNRYIKRILYGNRLSLLDADGRRPFLLDDRAIDRQIADALWMFEVVFDYGEHVGAAPMPDGTGAWDLRADPFSTRRAGFEIRTSRLCKRVLMFHHFDGEQDVGRNCLVSSTDLEHSQVMGPAEAEGPRYAFLTGVTQCGYRKKADGYVRREMPKLTLAYSMPTVCDTVVDADAASLENMPEGVDGTRYRWHDLHGEGVPGVLTEQAGTWFYKRNLSPIASGTFKLAPLERVALRPAVAIDQARFMDLAGDGIPDMVVTEGPATGFYEHDRCWGWERFKPFDKPLNRSFDDSNLRLIDLAGDGLADILVIEDDALVWHPSLGERGFGPARRVGMSKDDEQGPRLVFADAQSSIFLADMTGDGLTDIVRITEREVCYWPSLGYCRFGRKITMNNSPNLGEDGCFNGSRVMLADIDGSGTADLIHLHKDGIRLHFNLSGNGWSTARPLNAALGVDDGVSVMPLDLFATGTACLVCSSSAQGKAGSAMRYIDLMGGSKPHLLTAISNGLGAQTLIRYESSTRFYLADREAGSPWITKLPFPVHVVAKVDAVDATSGCHFVSTFSYHHGFYDGEEREFRGFGRVEQRDSQTFLELASTSPAAANIAESYHVPPTVTRTWYHTGAQVDCQDTSPLLAGLLKTQHRWEYFREPGMRHEDAAALLPESELPADLPASEKSEARRAMKGVMLRREVYAEDESDAAAYPYFIEENSYSVVQMQCRGGNRHGIYRVQPLEAIRCNYERNPADPRVTHSLTLEADDYGNVLKSVSVAYGRRREVPVTGGAGAIANPGFAGLTAWDIERQVRPLLSYTEKRMTEPIDMRDNFRAPVECESRGFELANYAASGPAGRYARRDFIDRDEEEDRKDKKDGAKRVHLSFGRELSYEQRSDEAKVRRPTKWLRTLFRSDDLKELLPLCKISSRALPAERYQLAFTPTLLQSLYGQLQHRADDLIPSPGAVFPGPGGKDGGYVSGDALKADGRFPAEDPEGFWWVPSGRGYFSDAGNPHELRDALSRFFMARRFVDPFGSTTLVSFDEGSSPATRNNLLPTCIEDAVGNRTTIVNDYRVLQPRLLTDPNDNQTEVRFDALGLVVGTAVMGKSYASHLEGDTFATFDADPDIRLVQDYFAASDPRAHAAELLGTATTRFLYDFRSIPARAAMIARETHISDLERDETSRLQLSFSYSDGFCREVGRKLLVAPGHVAEGGTAGTDDAAAIANPRWIGSGWTVFNNKGSPVRQYEPFFSATHAYEPDRRVGVSTIIFYDPAGRAVGTLHPDHSWEKVAFDAWQQRHYDCNDTLLLGDGPGGLAEDPDLGSHFSRMAETAYLPTWHQLRTAPSSAAALIAAFPDARDRDAEVEAAAKAALHSDTPTRIHLDVLGRPFLTLLDNGPDPARPTQPLLFAGRVSLDIDGNQVEVRDAVAVAEGGGSSHVDPLGRIVSVCRYNMIQERLYHASMDAGERWILNDVAGKPIRSWNGRGHAFRTQYDPLRRPLRSYVAGSDSGPTEHEILTERLVYGEQHAEAKSRNLNGRLFLHLDQAGVAIVEQYDIKGSATTTARRFTSGPQYRSTMDWRALDEDHVAIPPQPSGVMDLARLETALASRCMAATYANTIRRDALTRPVQLIVAGVMASGSSLNIIQPSYDQGNLLASLRIWQDVAAQPVGLLMDESTSQQIIRRTEHDAKGRRTLVEYGAGAGPGVAGVTSRYAYDRQTSRLRRLETRRGNAPGTEPAARLPGWPGRHLQELIYSYDAAGNVTRIRDNAQQTIFFRNRRVEPSTSYTYDATYRLIEAKGREHLGQTGATSAPASHSYNDAGRTGLAAGPGPFSPHDGVAMGLYTESYDYDPAGNLLAMRHRGDDPAAAGWVRSYSYLEPSTIEAGGTGTARKFSNRLTGTRVGGSGESHRYDAHGNMLTMSHLEAMVWNHLDQLQMTRRQRIADNDNSGIRHHGERTFYVYDASGSRVRKVTERPDGSLKDEWRYVGGAEFYICHSGSRAGLERQRLRLTDDVGQVAVIETRNHVDDGTARRLVRYQFPNHLGSASLELDQNAAIVTYEEFTPFGSTAYQAVRGQTDAPKRSRFAGKERDEESGLSYFGARYYASWLGRWTSCDRVRRTGQLYAFVGNNPIGHVDPDGNDEKPPPRMGSYTTPGNRGDIGTLVHTLVLTAIQLRLSVLGLVAVTEATTKPDGSKNINSTNSGRVDLAILVPDHAHPGSFIADVYDLKPGNVDQFYTYRSEVDHYTEHFQSNIAGLNISSARLGHTLRGLEKIEPRIFEPIRFRYGEYEITITPKLARDVNNRVVDGVLTYSLGVQKGDNVERFERNTRISINQTADAQAHGIVRASFMAGGMINLANAVAQFLSFGGALVYAALTGAAAGGTAGGGAGVVYRVAGNSTMRISGVEIVPNATVRVATGGVRVASEVVQAVEQAELQEVLVDTASELGAKVTANVLRIPLP